MSRCFSEQRVNIRDYGIRYDWRGSFYCGDHEPYNYLKFPQNPTLTNSAVKLLWAIQFASNVLADRPTRKQTHDICQLSKPLFKESKFCPDKTDNHGYWRDLYRRGYIKQLRRSYGKGSHKHFDIVYELTESGQNYLRCARNNQFAIEQPVSN